MRMVSCLERSGTVCIPEIILVLVIANILAPIPEKSLYASLARYRRLGNPRTIVSDLPVAGEMEKQMIDGVNYSGRTQERSLKKRRGACDSWRPSIHWSGIDAALNICGDGPTASKPTHRQPNAFVDTMRCRSSGIMPSLAGRTRA